MYKFSNDHTVQLSVVVPENESDVFRLYGVYDITVERGSTASIGYDTEGRWRLGVVTKRTKNSIHISSGAMMWVFPKCVCSFRPGTDVCLCVTLVEEHVGDLSA